MGKGNRLEDFQNIMIPHNRPTLGIEEETASLRVLRKGWLSQGEEVEKFENEFCDYLGLPNGHAVALSSGLLVKAKTSKSSKLYSDIISYKSLKVPEPLRVSMNLDSTNT